MTTDERYRRVFLPVGLALSALGLLVNSYDWTHGDVWAWKAVAACAGQICVFNAALFASWPRTPRYALFGLGSVLLGVWLVGVVMKLTHHRA
jgi:hypothetical protein